MKTIISFLYVILFLNSMYAGNFTNELAKEDSPYLRQHAHNPVNWMPWCKKAFDKAKKENKLIFLSIGYSTCHWCHVMERETFENEELAKILNDNYISIKVDKEERPDIDRYYQDIFYLLNRRAGGWPLNIVMTPNKEVIFAATYIPPYNSPYGRGFGDIMSFIAEKYKNNPKEIERSAKSIARAVLKYNTKKSQKSDVGLEAVGLFIEEVKNRYDFKYKGIGNKPKFPHASTFDTILDIYSITKDKELLKISKDALIAMANGGIYDQIEGGFYRYSVDNRWEIPHFEKMLYTNAELIAVYSKLYKIENSLHVSKIVKETIKAMDERFLRNGLYMSASDADSEGEEGKYFLFEYEKAVESLKKEGFGKSQIEKIASYLNITKNGNFENGKSNPHIKKGEPKPANLEKAKRVLKRLRSEVEYPFIDSKILTSWNALMAKALFEAEAVDKKYPKRALKLIDSIMQNLYKDGVLYHQLLFGSSLKVKGLLEDYAFLIEALIEAYEYSFDLNYLKVAKRLLKDAIKRFYKDGEWYLSDGDFLSSAPLEDGGYVSAKSVIIKDIFIISLLSEDDELYKRGMEMFYAIAGNLKRFPFAYASAVKVLLMVKKGEFVLKSYDNLSGLKKVADTVGYPYIFIYKNGSKFYQACSNKECFATEYDYIKFIEKVLNYFNKL